MPQKRTIPRVCQQCGKDFLARLDPVKNGKAKFCSPACQYIAQRVPPILRKCEQCGASFETEIGKINIGGGRFCSSGCASRHRAQNALHGPNWQGGRVRYGKPAYWYLYRPEHPNATQTGYVAEHRLVAEAKLGRYLLPDEDAHHDNLDRDDNSPDNIVVLTKSEHGRLHGVARWNEDRAAKMRAGRERAKAARAYQEQASSPSSDAASPTTPRTSQSEFDLGPL